jgi:hypothetical protein
LRRRGFKGIIGGMKLKLSLALLALGFVVATFNAQGGRGGGGGGGMGARPAPAPPAPATPAPPQRRAPTNAPAQTPPPGASKFGDLAVSSSFFFLSDTNRTYAWTKISATTGSNTVNGKLVAIKAETFVTGN